MPIPDPKKNETNKEFLDRCMADTTMQEYDDKQRYAICESKLRDNKMKNINERHIKKVVEDEENVTIIFGKSEDWEGVQIDTENEEEIIEDNLRKECDCGKYRDHIPGHDIEDEVEEEEEEELEEDQPGTYSRSNNVKH